MASRTLPGLGLKGFWGEGTDHWGDENDVNLRLLSALIQAGAIDKVNATPGSPADGDIHIFDGTHPTQPNKLAIRDNGDWVYLTPLEGWLVYNRNANIYETFTGAAWTPLATGGGGGIEEAPEDGKVYGRKNGEWVEIATEEPAVETSFSDPVSVGDRRSLITVTTNMGGYSGPVNALVDGSFAGSFYWANNSTQPGRWIKFDFGEPGKIIDGIKWYLSGDNSPQGTWRMQGSNDDFTWTDLGDPFILNEGDFAFANTTRYRYYRLDGVSGNMNNGPYQEEIEFKAA